MSTRCISSTSEELIPGRRRLIGMLLFMRATDATVVSSLTARLGPVFHIREAAALGVPRDTVRRLGRQLVLTPYGKGAYIESSALARANKWSAYKMRSSAFVLCCPPDGYLAGLAAAALHQLPVIRPPVELPTVLRPGSARKGPTTTEHGRVRHGFLPELHQMSVDRFRVVSLAMTVVDVARHFRRVDGLVMADAARAAGVEMQEFGEILAQMRGYPGISNARWAIENSDERAESALESVGRFVCLTQGLPTPLSNVWIGSAARRYRVDGLLPAHGIVLEGDGALKYDNRPDASQIVAAEKEREYFIRSLGYGVIRYNFALAYSRPREFAGRVEQLINDRRHLPAPTSWSLTDPRAPEFARRR